MTPPLMIFTPRVLPGTHPNKPKAEPSKASVNPLLPSAIKKPGAASRSRNPSHPPSPPEKKANDEHHPPQRAARGVRGVAPRKSTASHWRGAESPEHRATPGGYGGKPPGVAFIGVPTGARNAGSDAPTGDQSIDMNRTRKHPLVCQDPITTRSRDGPEQAQSPPD